MFRSTNVPFDECSVRRMFRSTNVPFDQCSFDESAFDESVFDESVVSHEIIRLNLLVKKIKSLKMVGKARQQFIAPHFVTQNHHHQLNYRIHLVVQLIKPFQLMEKAEQVHALISIKQNHHPNEIRFTFFLYFKRSSLFTHSCVPSLRPLYTTELSPEMFKQ